jgi:hypothetical protein
MYFRGCELRSATARADGDDSDDDDDDDEEEEAAGAYRRDWAVGYGVGPLAGPGGDDRESAGGRSAATEEEEEELVTVVVASGSSGSDSCSAGVGVEESDRHGVTAGRTGSK